MNINGVEGRAPRVESALQSDIGRKRTNNEDYVASYEPTDPQELQESGCLYIVADGVGGAAMGERVSEYAAEKVLYEYYQHPEIEPGERLRRVMSQVNSEINAFAEQNNTRMATTLVAVIVRGNLLTVANVGDSRAYLIHAGEAQQITHDHSIIGELIRNGTMTEAEAQQSKAKNRLSRSLGGESEVHVDLFPDILLQPGDKILLCTDGLTRYALREDISQMANQGSPKEIADELVNFANRNGGGDNVSVIVVAFEPIGATAISPRIQQPLREPASWEDMLTEQPVMLAKRKGIPRKAIPYVVLGLCLLLVTGLGIIVWQFVKPAAIAQAGTTTGAALTKTPPSGSASLNETSTAETVLINALLVTITPSPRPYSSEFPAPPNTPTYTDTPSPTDTPTFTATPTLTTTSTSEGSLPTVNPLVSTCRWTVTKGTTVWGLATDWAGIDPNNQSALDAYYQKIKCAPEPNGYCLYTQQSPYSLGTEWIILLPDIPIDTCKMYSGTTQ